MKEEALFEEGDMMGMAYLEEEGRKEKALFEEEDMKEMAHL